MTPRVRAVLEARWESVKKPQEGRLGPAPTKSGHINHASLKKQHARTFHTINNPPKHNDAKTEPKKGNEAPRIRSFVLYAFRHTFLTRLGQSGCEAWTLAQLAGYLRNWSSTARYVQRHGMDPVADFEREMQPRWGDASARREMRWPFRIFAGRFQ